MRFLTRGLMGLFLTFVTVALLFLAALQIWQASRPDQADERSGRGPTEQIYVARLLTVSAGPVQPQLQVFGNVQSRRELQLRAGAPGRIVELDEALQEGGAVTAGQLLLRIDPSAAQAALDNGLAQREDAQGALADARRAVLIARQDLAAAERQAELREAAVVRQQELSGRGLGTSADRETAELAASTAEQAVISRRAALADAESAITLSESALRRSEIDLSEAQRELADTELRAGFDGRVTDVTVVQGGLVSLNEQLATIIDPDALEVQIPLSLNQFARLVDADGKLGDHPVTVVLDGSAGQLTADARLDRAAASVASGSAGRIVFARITQGGGALRPGDFVRSHITEPTVEDAAVVPATAVGADGALLVADETGRLTAMTVTILRRQADDVVIRVTPELEGARIVAERAPQLGTGIRIRDADAPPDPEPEPDRQAQRGQGQGRG